MDAPTPPLDPVELIRQLDPEQIRQRIKAIDAERAALLKLLRVANTAQADRITNPARPEGGAR
jgi:hypothetical protein